MKQIIIINKDLKMSKGKIAVQACHGTTYYMQRIMRIVLEQTSAEFLNDMGKERGYNTFFPILEEEKINLKDYAKWFNSHMPKIVLKATEQEMIEFETNLKEKGIWTHRVYDLGKTQVPANSFTCLIVEPLEQSFNQFKLL